MPRDPVLSPQVLAQPRPSARLDEWGVLGALEVEQRRTQLARVQAARAAETTVPAKAFAKAASVWMLATFTLCYFLLPSAWDAVGLRDAQLWTLPGDFLALAAVWLGAMLLTAARHRRGEGLRVDLADLAGSDRLPAATLGSLLVWGFLHNVLPGLVPFGEMPAAWLAAFVGSNVLESALFGAVAATLARTRRGAFALGALGSAGMLGLAWIL